MSWKEFWAEMDAKARAADERASKMGDRIKPGEFEDPETGKTHKLSADRARTLRAKTRIANGYHPLGLRLREPSGETCGACKHLRVKEYAGRYFKCALARDTKGPATDVRKKWPACERWGAP